MIKKITEVRFILKTVAWAGHELSSISHRAMVLLALLALIDSILPACLALSTRWLINHCTKLQLSQIPDIYSVVSPLVITVLIVVIQNIIGCVKIFLTQVFRDKVALDVSSRIARHSATLDLHFFEISGNQNVLAKLNENTATHFSSCFTDTLAIVSDSIKLISLFMILFYIEPLIGVFILPLFLPYLFFKIRLAESRYRIHSNQIFKRRWTNYFVTLLTDPPRIAEIKNLGIAGYFLKKHKSLLTEINTEERGLYRKNLLGDMIFSTIANLVIFLLLFRVVSRALSHSLTIGDIVVFLGSTASLRMLLEKVSTLIGSLHEHCAYINNYRIFIRSNTPSGTVEKKRTGNSGKNKVEMDNVSFTYPGSSQKVINNISFQIYPGETIAIVGENGSGKTTLAKLIAGIYRADSGEIRLDGKNILEYDQDQLVQKVGFVFQNFNRFEATVKENIGFGNVDRMQTDPDFVRSIAEKVKIDGLIKDFPDGYNTKLGKLFGSHEISGGQWQYIAVARAFAKDSSLLILDEPTANLDVRNELKLFNLLRDITLKRTTILISHRFSTVKIADRIIVMADGEIVESGPHDDLLENDSLYSAMFNTFHDQARYADK